MKEEDSIIVEELNKLVEKVSEEVERFHVLEEDINIYLFAVVKDGNIRMRVGYHPENVKVIDLSVLHAYLSLVLRDVERKLYDILRGEGGEDEEE